MFSRWPAYAKCHLEIPRSSYVLFFFCCVGGQRSKISAQMFLCKFSSFCCVCVHMFLLILSFCLFTTEVTCLATSESNCILKSGVQWGRVLAWLGALQLWRRLLPWPNRKSHANGCFFVGGMLIFKLFLHLSFLYYPKCDWRYVCKIFMVWQSNILI